MMKQNDHSENRFSNLSVFRSMEDSDLTPIQQLAAYLNSGTSSDLMECPSLVSESVCQCNIDLIHQFLLPAIEGLINCGDEQASAAMAVAIPDFGETLFDFFADDANNILSDYVMPIFVDSINSQCFPLEETIAESFAATLTLLDPPTFIAHQLPTLKDFAKSSNKEIRAFSANVLSYLVEYFDSSLWYQQLYELTAILSIDEVGSVRCLVPPIISAFMKKIPSPREKAQFSGRYLLFCRDSNVNVRKAAAESLVTLSESLDPINQAITVIPSANLLTVDSSEIVRSAITRALGPLISSLGPRANAELVDRYCSSLTSYDVNVAFAAAFSFPAVANAIGKERWCELKSAFESATQSREFRIRRTLAYGICSFYDILDGSDLCEVACCFLRDIPTVSIGIISHLHEIVSKVDQKEDLEFCLLEPSQKYKEWRLRLQVSQQLRNCIDSFDKNALFNSAKELVCDEVYTVRKDAAKSFAVLMDHSNLGTLDQLAKSDSYLDRWIAAVIIGNREDGLGWQELVQLSKDKVANVRIAVAKSAKILCNNAELDNNIKDELSMILNILQADKDVDVKNAAA